MLIERDRWKEYLAELSRQAEGYAVAIEIFSAELGDQTEVRRARLSELAYDARDGIVVAVSDPSGHEELLRHVITEPVRLEATDEVGVPGALLIEEAAGTKTLVRLAAPDG